MIHLKFDKVRVRCLECKEEYFIDVKIVDTDKERRSMGYEYYYYIEGNTECTTCGDKLLTSIDVFEYPKDWINYAEISDEGCLVMDDLEWNENKLTLTTTKYESS